MPERLAIPAEIARAVLVESGHRCAVCGDLGGLQVVHVVASHGSGEDNAEDLICLCANCHQRADTEKWGQKILKEYKLHPWVVRQTRDGPVAEDWRALGSRPGPGVRPEAPEPKDGRENLLGRVTANPAIFGGKPIIRGMRISVEMILSLLAQGETRETLLADYPELEPEDIRACLAYAHAVIAHDCLDAVEIARP